MFTDNIQGKMKYIGGKNEYAAAARTADHCPNFKLDEEDEMVADQVRSCYNCRYRRWTEDSFICCNPNSV